jgi:hypothetical protein
LIDYKAMRLAFEDPLFPMTTIKRYEDDATGLYNALNNLYGKIKSRGVEYNEYDLSRIVFYFLAVW